MHLIAIKYHGIIKIRIKKSCRDILTENTCNILNLFTVFYLFKALVI